MPIVDRPADRGRRRARAALRHVADDGRMARVSAGLSQRDVARAVGSSHSKVGRFERRASLTSDLEFVAAYCAVVGLDLAIRTYPAGDPIRDRAQLALLERLRSRIHPALRWRTEVPLPIEGDLRTWDAEIRGRDPRPWRGRVEAETRIADGQALERKLALKLGDDPDGHLILLVSDTRSNRLALKALGPGLMSLLPHGTREILSALAAGREPAGSGIVVM
jgi:transcriptional regulator with XRE-family HTH domain